METAEIKDLLIFKNLNDFYGRLCILCDAPLFLLMELFDFYGLPVNVFTQCFSFAGFLSMLSGRECLFVTLKLPHTL